MKILKRDILGDPTFIAKITILGLCVKASEAVSAFLHRERRGPGALGHLGGRGTGRLRRGGGAGARWKCFGRSSVRAVNALTAAEGAMLA